MSDHSPSAALRHRRSRRHAAPSKFREVWSARRTKRSPDCEPARTTRLATPQPIQRCKKMDALTLSPAPLHFPQRHGLNCGNGDRARPGCPLRVNRYSLTMSVSLPLFPPITAVKRTSQHFRKLPKAEVIPISRSRSIDVVEPAKPIISTRCNSIDGYCVVYHRARIRATRWLTHRAERRPHIRDRGFAG